MLSRRQIECLPQENLNAHAETIAKQKKGSLRENGDISTFSVKGFSPHLL
jgi:hypothetical protein